MSIKAAGLCCLGSGLLSPVQVVGKKGKRETSQALADRYFSGGPLRRARAHYCTTAFISCVRSLRARLFPSPGASSMSAGLSYRWLA
jgi:hypothetical protein